MEYKNSNTISVRYEVLRDGGVWTELEPYTPAEVQYQSASALKMSMRGLFLEPKKEIRWLTDRLRPVLIINGTEYPVGKFIATTPQTNKTAGQTLLQLEAYSVLYLAERVQLEGPYTIARGTSYITAVIELLRLAGITEYTAEESALVLSTDRADWPAGTKVLTVVNQLLSEINYRSAWVDMSGRVWLTKYKAPSTDNITQIYQRGEYSILSDVSTVTTDYFDKANVFRAVCSNPELEEPMMATAENSDPDSPFSTASLGIRILQILEVDNIPDLATLQEKAENMLTKSLQTTETIEFTTALNPTHGIWDTVALDMEDKGGIWTETEWSMVLDASGSMRHKAERVVIL